MERVIAGRVLVAGQAEGRALVAVQPLSFWGGYDQQTGEIIDRRHPLSGAIAAGKVLVIPGSRGSSTTSAVFLEAIRLGTAPAALIVTQIETFLTLASIVADEMFGTPVPILAIDQLSFESIRNDVMVRVERDGTIALTE